MAIKPHVLSLCLLLPLANASCAQDQDPTPPGTEATTTAVATPAPDVTAEILENQAVLLQSENHKNNASIYFFGSASPEQIALWMLALLEHSGVDSGFRQKLAPRLKMNPRLAANQFKLPITDLNGNTHLFILENKQHNQLSGLHYQNIQPTGG